MMPAISGQGITLSAMKLPMAIDYPAALTLRELALSVTPTAIQKHSL